MNKYVKSYLHRGMLFGGFGPIVVAIVYLILSFAIEDFILGGREVFLGIVSIYILAFVHAGASVFNQIEHWSVPKSLLFHFGTLYIAYTVCYLINSWIPFNIVVFAVYTAIFVIVYLVIWLAVFISIKLLSKKINKRLP